MPLEQGKSDDARSRNIEEMLRSYKSTGKIGNIRPRSLEHARKIAAAAAYREQRESGEKK